MKNGKLPTRQQKEFIKSHGYNPESYLIVKDTSECMEIVSRIKLKKQKVYGTKPHTKKLYKD